MNVAKIETMTDCELQIHLTQELNTLDSMTRSNKVNAEVVMQAAKVKKMAILLYKKLDLRFEEAEAKKLAGS